MPSAELRASDLARDGIDGPQVLEAVILAILGSFPGLISDHLDLLERMEPSDRLLDTLRSALLSAPEGLDDVAFQHHLEGAHASEALEILRGRRHVALNPCFGAGRGGGPDPEAARMALHEVAAKWMARRGWDREMQDAQDEILDATDEGLTWRLSQIAERLQKPEGDAEEAVIEVVTAPNGLELDRREREQSRKVLDAITFEKKTRPGRG